MEGNLCKAEKNRDKKPLVMGFVPYCPSQTPSVGYGSYVGHQAKQRYTGTSCCIKCYIFPPPHPLRHTCKLSNVSENGPTALTNQELTQFFTSLLYSHHLRVHSYVEVLIRTEFLEENIFAPRRKTYFFNLAGIFIFSVRSVFLLDGGHPYESYPSCRICFPTPEDPDIFLRSTGDNYQVSYCFYFLSVRTNRLLKLREPLGPVHLVSHQDPAIPSKIYLTSINFMPRNVTVPVYCQHSYRRRHPCSRMPSSDSRQFTYPALIR